MTITTKKGRQSIPPGSYDPATGKKVSWNVTASDVNVKTETEALVVKETGYYNMFRRWWRVQKHQGAQSFELQRGCQWT